MAHPVSNATSTNLEIAPTPIAIDALPFANTFASLPSSFFTRLQPTPLPHPYLVAASKNAAGLIGLDTRWFSNQDWINAFSGCAIPLKAQPLAAVYSGHQFGVWAGQLGDGRAILMGELPSLHSPFPHTLEIQLKGAGPTPYSRMGDGRAVLRSSIREFLCSEAMAGLGIATSRALCITGSDQFVMREVAETAAIVTRMAPTFIRFGSFEHWYYNARHVELKLLADHVIDRFLPHLREHTNPYLAMLVEVVERTAMLIAHWQAVGFMHGVLNTDNMSILGLTLDYGPFGFMEAFDTQAICNHSDHQGRYSYAMQPQIGHWNCAALAQACMPLIGEVEAAQDALALYGPKFDSTLSKLLHAKLGLELFLPEDNSLFDALFSSMQNNQVDFTIFFRRLGNLQSVSRTNDRDMDSALRDLFIDRTAFDRWAVQYRTRLQKENSQDAHRKVRMNSVNPKYVLRNYLAQNAIDQANKKDFNEIARLLAVLENPFDEHPEHEQYAVLPPDWANQLEVSCSS
jgi:uncharacterized protein YdiU (UPF0061 family)